LKTIRGDRVWWTKHNATFHRNRKIEENKNIDNMHIFGIAVCTYNILQEKKGLDCKLYQEFGGQNIGI
jgi:hypothetical protein